LTNTALFARIDFGRFEPACPPTFESSWVYANMKSVLYFLIHKARTLQVSVLTLFLSLFILSFLAVSLFTNSALVKSTENLSTGISHRLSGMILEKFQTLAASAEETVQLGAYLYWDMGEVSYANKQLMSLMLNFVKTNRDMTTYFVAQENGTFIAVINLARSIMKTYQNDRDKPLPSNAAYYVRAVDRTKSPVTDTSYYLDADFQLIDSEVHTGTPFDPRVRDWYVEVMKDKALTWTDFYLFPTGEKGITVAVPIIGKQGEIAAVVGADLTLALLTHFLAGKTVGKTGRAFIVDDWGEIIFPPVQKLNDATYTEGEVKAAFQEYLDHTGRVDFLFTYEGHEFLTHVSDMPPVFGTSHWNIVSLVPFEEVFFEILIMWKNVFWIILGILILTSGIVVYFSKRISSPIVVLSKEIDKLRNFQLEQEERIRSNVKEIILMDASVSAMRSAIRSISRYVPKEIVRGLFQKGEDIVLGGEKKEITIFFSDIESFTTIAESQPIDVLLSLLAEYFGFMSKIILQSGGTIDKYMGDGIMAFWGAPLDMSDHAVRAALSALQCNKNVALLNQKRRAEGKPGFPTRFGINLGTVIVGNIGTEERMNYTVIGDAVNTTFRFQDIDKFYHTKVIMGEEVCKRLGSAFLYRPLDLVAVKGKTEKTKIYELVALREGEAELLATPEEIALCQDFTKAYEAYQQGDLVSARALFSAIAQKFPGDYPTAIYLQRLNVSTQT
jgi:adenylate cyclase